MHNVITMNLNTQKEILKQNKIKHYPSCPLKFLYHIILLIFIVSILLVTKSKTNMTRRNKILKQ